MIDFAKDLVVVRKGLEKAVGKYVKGGGPGVTRVDLDVWLGDGGETLPGVRVHFDTVEREEVDAVWTHEGVGVIEFPAWKEEMDREGDEGMGGAELSEALDGRRYRIRTLDGVEREVSSAKLDQVLHGFLVEALVAAREAGVFEKLPRKKGCQLGVVNNDCGFGWPAYEDAGLENMADPRENGKRLWKGKVTGEAERVKHDEGAYDVWVEPGKASRAVVVAAVSSVMGVGIGRAKEMVEKGVAVDVKAGEVRRIAKRLKGKGVGVRVWPGFPYSLE
jgi:hypothetical protein